jgi:sec-independent protein translocase protein TatA
MAVNHAVAKRTMLESVLGIGQWELIVLAVIVVLLFGSKRVPQISRTLGRGMREFKQTVGAVDPREDVRRAIEAPKDEPQVTGDDKP